MGVLFSASAKDSCIREVINYGFSLKQWRLTFSSGKKKTLLRYRDAVKKK